AEFRIARLTERLVKALPIEFGELCDLRHAARPLHDSDRVPHESWVASFKRGRDVSGLPFRRVEIFGSIEPCRCNHPCFPAISRAIACARLISRGCVRLSPAHNRTTIFAPRR